MNETPTLDDVQRARTRIRDYVRLTPLIPALPAKAPLFAEGRLSLKLECLQIVGSFKARGASAKLTSLDEAAVRRGLVTASGGNHGLGVAYAGWRAGAPARVYLPRSTPKAKADKIAAWGAEPFVGLQGCRLLNIRLIMIQIRCQSKLFATGRRGVAVIVSFRSRRVS